MKDLKTRDDFEKKRTLIEQAYKNFNQRNINSVLSVMDKDVTWPNGMEGGVVSGHEGVRDYWTRQWTIVNPNVKPLQFKPLGANKIIVDVHQVVRDMENNIIMDRMVQHIYTIEDGFIKTMEIKED